MNEATRKAGEEALRKAEAKATRNVEEANAMSVSEIGQTFYAESPSSGAAAAVDAPPASIRGKGSGAIRTAIRRVGTEGRGGGASPGGGASEGGVGLTLPLVPLPVSLLLPPMLPMTPRPLPLLVPLLRGQAKAGRVRCCRPPPGLCARKKRRG